MAHRQMHLNKNGGGMAAKTACGRNILRTPMSTSWVEFNAEPAAYRCVKCEFSKHADFLRRQDAKAA